MRHHELLTPLTHWVLGNQPSRRFNAIAESNHSGRSGDAGNAGTVANPDRINSPATRCSSRRFRGTKGLPNNRNNNNPIPGRKKINNNHAIADDGRRRSGTNPNTTTFTTNNTPDVTTVQITGPTLPRCPEPQRPGQPAVR
jgi:hypothetical protein